MKFGQGLKRKFVVQLTYNPDTVSLQLCLLMLELMKMTSVSKDKLAGLLQNMQLYNFIIDSSPMKD